MNNRATNYDKAYKLTKSYYENTNPYMLKYQDLVWHKLFLLPKKRFKEYEEREDFTNLKNIINSSSSYVRNEDIE